MKYQPTTDREQPFWNIGALVAGVDEAGRGCLAGPVVAAAVVLPARCTIEGLNDSKQLSPKKRDELFDKILDSCTCSGIGIRDERCIENHNILQATMYAMHDAIAALQPQPLHLLIDGNYFRAHRVPHTTVVDGDALCLSIAAASVLAKVTRDRWMVEVADVHYPDYGFARHKGYATREHREAIVRNGPCPLHRMTFLSNVLSLFPVAETQETER